MQRCCLVTLAAAGLLSVAACHSSQAAPSTAPSTSACAAAAPRCPNLWPAAPQLALHNYPYLLRAVSCHLSQAGPSSAPSTSTGAAAAPRRPNPLLPADCHPLSFLCRLGHPAHSPVLHAQGQVHAAELARQADADPGRLPKGVWKFDGGGLVHVMCSCSAMDPGRLVPRRGRCGAGSSRARLSQGEALARRGGALGRITRTSLEWAGL